MKKKLTVTFIFLFITLFFSVSAEDLFNNEISDIERENLYSGKVVIRNIESLKGISISCENDYLDKLLLTAKNLKPVYLAEIIQIKPYEGNENLIENIDSSIIDIGSYAGIPYYSERAEAWYDLYSSATIVSQESDETSHHLLADLDMKPFGIINTKIDIEKNDSEFYYESTNLNKLRYYDKFTCVQPEKMKSLIVVFRDNDKWILYGLGAVNAPSIFFLRERVETSFMNRIKTFCSFFFDKI